MSSVEKLAYRVAEAADMIGVSTSKMYELLAAGSVPSVRIGCSVRVPADALKRWIAEHTTAGASTARQTP